MNDRDDDGGGVNSKLNHILSVSNALNLDSFPISSQMVEEKETSDPMVRI